MPKVIPVSFSFFPELCPIVIYFFLVLVFFPLIIFWFDDGLTVKFFADHSQFLSLIGQLQEAANKAKHESNEDELTEISGDEELGELAPETNVCLLSLVLLSLDFF